MFLSSWRASELVRAVAAEFLTFEVDSICLKQAVTSKRLMDRARYLQQQLTGCYDAYQTPLSSVGACQQQVVFASLLFSRSLQ